MAWSNRIDPNRDRDLFERVQAAEPVWRAAAGDAEAEADLTWGRVVEARPVGPQPLAWGRVVDRVEGATIPDEKFTPGELGDRERLFDRFLSVWSRLLRARSHIQLGRLHELVKSLPGD